MLAFLLLNVETNTLPLAKAIRKVATSDEEQGRGEPVSETPALLRTSRPPRMSSLLCVFCLPLECYHLLSH